MNLASIKANVSTTVSGCAIALSGFATFVAGFASQLGALGDLIPQDERKTVLLVGGIATALSTALHGLLTKSASVSGNGTVNAPAQVDQGDGTSKTLPLSLIVALLLPALVLTGCSSTGSSTPATTTGAPTATPKPIDAQKVLTTAGGILQLGWQIYTQVSTDRASGKKPDPNVIAAQLNTDLNTAGSILQAYKGQPLSDPNVQANVVNATTNPAAIQQVVANLPQGTITQATINNVYSAAAQTSAP